MATKANPGRYDCHGAAYDDEPIFTLRAKDPLAPVLVKMWTEMRELSRPIDREADPGREREKRREALQCAEEMRRWRDENPRRGTDRERGGAADEPTGDDTPERAGDGEGGAGASIARELERYDESMLRADLDPGQR